MRGRRARRVADTHETEGKGKREKRGGRRLPVAAVVRQRHEYAQRVLDVEKRTLSSFSEARRPRPLHFPFLAPFQRPREGDLSFHGEPSVRTYAFSALGGMVVRVERNIDSVGPWQKSVHVVERKGERGSQQANVVECGDGMSFTKGLVRWLALLRGDRMARRICTRR